MTRTRFQIRPTASAHRPLAARRTGLVLVAGVALLTALVASCSSPKSSSSSTTTSTLAPGVVTTTTTPEADAVVFAATEGNIDAYLPTDPFTRQRVVAAGTGPAGTTPHGQICFDSNGSRRFVVAETRTPVAGATTPASAGWGVYQLTGNDIGSFDVHRLTGWDSPSAPSTDAPSTYGCAFLSTGQLITTDVGNRHDGDATGQLVEFFPPFDGTTPASCTLATALGSPLGLSVGNDDTLYLASSRAPTAGVWRYSGTFPASATDCVPAVSAAPATPGTTLPPASTTTTTSRSGGSGGNTTTTGGSTRPTTPPAATTPLVASLFIPAGQNQLSTPSAVSVVPSGEALVVTSPPDGVIAAYQTDGTYVGSLLKPNTGSTLGPKTSFPGGTPFGVVVSPQGAVIYADPGYVRDAKGQLVPGTQTASLRTIETQEGSTAIPQDIDTGLQGTDGLGLYVPSGGGGAASKA